MSRRVKVWAVALGAADVVCFALTLHAHLVFHRAGNGPSVMPVGQLLGWSFTILLLIALAVLLFAARADARYRQARAPRYRE